jgi:hypothetical protein
VVTIHDLIPEILQIYIPFDRKIHFINSTKVHQADGYKQLVNKQKMILLSFKIDASK